MGWLWVVGPKVLTDNSTEETLQRNNSVWWCIYMFSMVIGREICVRCIELMHLFPSLMKVLKNRLTLSLGNLANYFYLGDLTSINTGTRVIIYIICCGFVLAGAFVALLGYQNIPGTLWVEVGRV